VIPLLVLACAPKRSEVPLLLAKTSDSVLYVGALSSEPGLRARSYEILLSTASEEELMDWLPKALADPEPYVRRSSMAAALHSGAPAFTGGPLSISAGDRCWLELHAAWAGVDLELAGIREPARGSEDRLLCALVDASATGDLAGLSTLVGSEVLPGTKTFYHALGRSGLAGLSEALAYAVEEGEDFVRLPLLCAWVALDEAALPLLKAELGPLDAMDRMDAVDLLASFQGEAVLRLLRQLEGESGPASELAGLVLLEQGRKSPRSALRMLEESPDRDMKVRAALALGRWLAAERGTSAGNRVEEGLVSLLGSEEPALRAAAARALGESGQRSAIRHLQKMEEERMDVQLEIVGAIRLLAYGASS
jgi:hypothetical protein